MTSSKSTGRASRAQASRLALLTAFNDLIVNRSYAEFGVTEIVSRADVSRSTFYEHFKSKDDLLRHSMARVISPLAATCDLDHDVQELNFMLEHFRENRSLALGLMNGPSSKQVISLFASLIEERLAGRPRRAPTPLFLVAAQIAESQVGLIRAWLNRGGSEPAMQVGVSLTAGTRALVDSLL